MEENEGSEGGKPWHMYTANSAPSASQTNGIDHNRIKYIGTSSMSAISFGFIATAVLISMFLIMAIFEYLFRPNNNNNNNSSFFSSQNSHSRSSMQKNPPNSQLVSTYYGSDFSVMMPGQQYPTYIAQPAPLPCPREGTYWPSHKKLGLP